MSLLYTDLCVSAAHYNAREGVSSCRSYHCRLDRLDETKTIIRNNNMAAEREREMGKGPVACVGPPVVELPAVVASARVR